MDWAQVVTILSVTLGFSAFFWNLSRRETERLEKICELAREDSKEFRNEIKDFHGRLCALEEKYIQMMERYWESKK